MQMLQNLTFFCPCEPRPRRTVICACIDLGPRVPLSALLGKKNEQGDHVGNILYVYS